MSSADSLLAPVPGAECYEIGGALVDTVRVGAARLNVMVYPPGFRWSTHIKPIIGTDLCMHAHAGFLARGQINVQYPDGWSAKFTAPQAAAIDPGHDAWIVGDEPAVLIEFDFGSATIVSGW